MMYNVGVKYGTDQQSDYVVIRDIPIHEQIVCAMTSAITGALFLEVSVLQVSVKFFGRLQRSSQESGLTSDLLRDAEQLVLRPRQTLEQVGEVRATPSLGVPADSTITHPRIQYINFSLYIYIACSYHYA